MVKFDLLPSPLARLRRSCLGGREVKQNKSIFEVCLKFRKECAYDAYSNAFYLFFGKERQKYFFNLALKIRKLLYENGYKAFDMYGKTEIRSSVLINCSVKYVLFKSFSSSFSFSNLLFMF